MKLLGASALIAAASAAAVSKPIEDKVEAIQQRLKDIKAGRNIGGLKSKIQDLAEGVFDDKFDDFEEKFELMWNMYEKMNADQPQENVCETSFAALKSWGDAVTAQDKPAVLSHYAEGGTLWPTLSNMLREDPYWIGDYFDLFLAKIAGTENVDWANNVCQAVSDTHAMWSGTYVFTLKSGPATARYSYLLVKNEEFPAGWQIVHHHSSLMPEPVVAKQDEAN